MDKLITNWKKSEPSHAAVLYVRSSVTQGPLRATDHWLGIPPAPEPVPYLSQKLLWLTGPLSAGPSATRSPESFHCSTEQQLPIATGIDFQSSRDSATITSLLKKLVEVSKNEDSLPFPDPGKCSKINSLLIYTCSCNLAPVKRFHPSWKQINVTGVRRPKWEGHKPKIWH